MILFPPAKINLGLNVLSKRMDGYHNIETAMFTIPLFDVLEILPAEEFKFIQTGLVIDSTPEKNLCVRAFRLLQEEHGIGNVYMHIRKNIPMGAGLGGGSSDAAYVLKGLTDQFQLNLTKQELQNYAGILGSDCPFFIDNSSQIAHGKGELLDLVDINLKGYFLKLVYPEIHVGTEEAYSGVRFSENEESIRQIVEGPLSNWKIKLKNDFESSIFSKHPEIEQLKESLYAEGAEYASMSGSGSSVYGIYKNEPSKSFDKKFEFILQL